jgi:hypothetical protein
MMSAGFPPPDLPQRFVYLTMFEVRKSGFTSARISVSEFMQLPVRRLDLKMYAINRLTEFELFANIYIRQRTCNVNEQLCNDNFIVGQYGT